MPLWAGIGSRTLNKNELNFCWWTGWLMAKCGWDLVTGAATGADQKFAEGAIAGGGKVYLEIPWYSYEEKWVNWARSKGAIINVLAKEGHKDALAAYQSVKMFHPKADNLSSGAFKLHARNFNIVLGPRGKRHVNLVVAWPKSNKWGNLGGTGQGLKIAARYRIKVENLELSETRKRITRKMKAVHETQH